MKILITGYTSRMWGSRQVIGDYVTFSFLLEEILIEMGHEVHRRKTMSGEKLSHLYDFAFIGVAPLSSITSGRVVESHHAMSEMEGKHVVYCDDWSFCNFGNSVRYTLDRWDSYLKYKKFPYESHVTDKTFESLTSMMFYNHDQNAPVLAPMFPWGDHQFLMKGIKDSGNYKARLITVDPSIWLKYPTIDIPQPKDKKRQWVMAALSDHSKWLIKQHFKIPVKYVGNKRMPNPLVLTEAKTIELFANSFGVLSTGYPSAGSGWWRTRYLNAAWAESIIYSDPKDAAVMGPPYQGTVDFFEGLTSEKDYEYVVLSQAEWLSRNISTKETVMTTFERILNQ